MHDVRLVEPATTEALVETLVSYGVVCTTAADGVVLCELYSLLECLAPEEEGLAERLYRVRLVPKCTADLGCYLLYIPLYDALAHLLPDSVHAVAPAPSAAIG
jgi:hypothetical protein